MFNIILFLVSSRQFLGVIVINPGAAFLLEAISVSQDLLPLGQSGLDKCNTILEGWVLLKHCVANKSLSLILRLG